MGERGGAFLEDDWCEIFSYGFEIYHFMCMVGNIDVSTATYTFFLSYSVYTVKSML